jgi:NhaP-type Na+/H+ or K+/H+ antiporter
VVRPAVALLSLVGLASERVDRAKVAFFGVRGMGSVFYIAYAQNSAEFPGIDGVWRVAGIVILVSIIAHGFTAKVAVDPGEGDEDDKPELHPLADGDARRAAE